MYKYILILFFLILYSRSFASDNPFPIGARGWGIGNAVVAFPTQQTNFYNPAGLGYLETSSGFASYHSRYDFIGLGNAAVGVNLITKIVNIGIALDQFGDKLYSESRVGIALSKKQGRIALGLKANYFQIAIEDVATKGTLLTEFGVMADIRDNFRIGFHGYNLTGSSLFISKNVPTVLRLGFSFKPSKQIAINAEAEKSSDYKLNIKTGLEYEIREAFFLRTGVNSLTNSFHFGTGFMLKHLQFDYAVHTSNVLGLSHHLTIGANLTKKGGKDEK